jgi:ribose 5-phosphate isomerase
MIRVTIEVVPYGMESLAKTISELCVETTDGTSYESAGYVVHTDNRIEEFGKKLDSFETDSDVMKLIKELINAETCDLEKLKLAEYLLGKTRLAGELNETE